MANKVTRKETVQNVKALFEDIIDPETSYPVGIFDILAEETKKAIGIGKVPRWPVKRFTSIFGLEGETVPSDIKDALMKRQVAVQRVSAPNGDKHIQLLMYAEDVPAVEEEVKQES